MKKPEIKVLTAADVRKLIELNKKSMVDCVLSHIAEQAAKGRTQYGLGPDFTHKQHVITVLIEKGFIIDGNLVKW